MSRQPGLSEWIDLVSTHMPHLSVPQARVLALWSEGIALTRSCGRLTVATWLALPRTGPCWCGPTEGCGRGKRYGAAWPPAGVLGGAPAGAAPKGRLFFRRCLKGVD